MASQSQAMTLVAKPVMVTAAVSAHILFFAARIILFPHTINTA